ncbi:MAG: hypothetical protein ACSHWQ_00080 [Spongiibacteraceae bacterium]
MARTQGLLSLSANFEPQIAEPFDARAVVETKSDLVDANGWKAKDGTVYAYVGMPVIVKGDGVSNGLYWLKAPDYTLLSNWEFVSGGGSGTTLPSETAGENLSGYRAVYMSATGLKYASASDTANADSVLGITVSAASSGAVATYQYQGDLTVAGTPFTPRDPVWLGENGLLTQTPPATGLSIILGSAKTASIISINIQQPIEVL